MTRISNLTAIDPRSDWSKISRRQYWKGAKALNIPFPVGATQPQMINICQAAGVTPDQVAKFVPVRVSTATGETVVMLPEDNERKYDEKKELRRAEEMEKRIAAGIEQESAEKKKMEAEKDAEIGILRSELDDMKQMMAQLLEQQKPFSNKPVEKITDPNRNQHMYEDRKLGKTYNQLSEKYGLSGPRCRQIIKKLEAQDGKDTSDGS